MLISSAISAASFTPVGHIGRTPGLDALRATDSIASIDAKETPLRLTKGNNVQAPLDRRESAPAAVYNDPRVEAQRNAREAAEAKKQLVDAVRIKELAARDREVRAHEQAHVAVGGRYASGAVYQYERGPNGVSYAVGGEVSISVGPASTPEETLLKAQTIRRAALAPAEPSPQDRKVAAEASRMEAQARQELAESPEPGTHPEKARHAEERPAIADEKDTSVSPAGLGDGNNLTDGRNNSFPLLSAIAHHHHTPAKPQFLTGYQLTETIGGVIDSRA